MPTQSLSVTVIRPDDLLVLRLELVDVDFTPPVGGDPARVAGQTGARLIVHFQPQHVAEQAFWEMSEGVTPDPPEPGGPDIPSNPGSVLSLLAGPSRICYTIPAGRSFDLTVASVLEAIRTLPLTVTRVARYEPPSGCNPSNVFARVRPPEVARPAPFETALELPYRLFLSPDHFGWWDHATAPVEHDGRTELWHTRLGSRRASGDPRVRAIWSPDFKLDPDPPSNKPFRMALNALDRNEIVQLTSNYHLDNFTPDPVETNRLMLTTLGGWLDVEGRWVPPPATPLSVENWRHIATMGRDHYVRVVRAGYLYPLGHRASLVKVTERKFFFRNVGNDPGFVAYDFQRMFIIVRERSKSYTPRDFPLRSVDILTKVTPNLAKPEASEVLPGQNERAFWPRILAGGAIADFQFHLAGRDWEGRAVEFTAPLIFVNKSVDENDVEIKAVIAAYEALPLTDARRKRPLNGQPVAFAPRKEPNDTTHEAAWIALNGAFVDNARPQFRPKMARAGVGIPAVKQLLGKPTVVSEIEFEDTFVNHNGQQTIGNAAQVFAKLVAKTPLEFEGDKSGGLARPDLGISGLSRSLGPIGGTAASMVSGGPNPGEGRFDPAAVFGNVKLLGGIKLSDILRVLDFMDASHPSIAGKLPQLVNVRDGDILRTKYLYKVSGSDLKQSDLFIPDAGCEFLLEAVAEKRIDTVTPPVFRTTGSLTNFRVVLLPPLPTETKPNALYLVELSFKEVKFVVEPGKKVDTSVDFGGLAFKGILEFVQELQRYIPSDGFVDPPYLELVPPPDAGVNVGFTLGIPTIGIGIMTMQNISLSAGFYLPFVDKPMNFRFAFCERHQPFTLTVSLFGGGGFFAIDIGLGGVKSIEAALEFGASIALNLGVASGSASIMAGFYFRIVEGGLFELTGYFRACGSLSVLGIITVSIEFYLGLTYASKGIVPHGGHLWGQARVTVKISILFFSVSVGITLEREFAGSDPTFRQLMPALNDWELYCGSFADYGLVPED